MTLSACLRGKLNMTDRIVAFKNLLIEYMGRSELVCLYYDLSGIADIS